MSARTRQLNHKLRNRRAAIMARRETDGVKSAPAATIKDVPTTVVPVEANASSASVVRSVEPSQSPPSGFTAVNVRQSLGGSLEGQSSLANELSTAERRESTSSNLLNGKSAEQSRPDYLDRFLTPQERAAGLNPDTVRRSSFRDYSRDYRYHVPSSNSPYQTDREKEKKPSESSQKAISSVPIPGTPATLMPLPKAFTPATREDGGPFKADMVAKMETMERGERVIPPCDRCRRLQMDCLKNLTACIGCTKKHAKCSWKEVTAEELAASGIKTDKDKEHVDEVMEDAPPSAGARKASDASRSKVNKPGIRYHSPLDATISYDEPNDTIEVASIKSSVAPPGMTSPPPSSARSTSHASPRFNVRPPPLEQQLEDAANGKGHGSRRTPSHGESGKEKPRVKDRIDEDEGDRLQALAAQVYRSASQQGMRVEREGK